MKRCTLEAEKICNNCGTCDDRCELDPQKICDNCFRCLDETTEAYAKIPITGVYLDDDFCPEPEEFLSDEREEEYVLDTDEDWKKDDHWQVKTLPDRCFAERVRRTHQKH